MAASMCTSCDIPIRPPSAPSASLEEKADCPRCRRPLIWIAEGREEGRWFVDEGVEGLRRMAEGPDGLGRAATA